MRKQLPGGISAPLGEAPRWTCLAKASYSRRALLNFSSFARWRFDNGDVGARIAVLPFQSKERAFSMNLSKVLLPLCAVAMLALGCNRNRQDAILRANEADKMRKADREG